MGAFSGWGSTAALSAGYSTQLGYVTLSYRYLPTSLAQLLQHNTGANAQAPFGTQQVVVARCSEGHTSSIYDPPEPFIALDIEQSAATALQRHYGVGMSQRFFLHSTLVHH